MKRHWAEILSVFIVLLICTPMVLTIIYSNRMITEYSTGPEGINVVSNTLIVSNTFNANMANEETSEVHVATMYLTNSFHTNSLKDHTNYLVFGSGLLVITNSWERGDWEGAHWDHSNHTLYITGNFFTNIVISNSYKGTITRP